MNNIPVPGLLENLATIGFVLYYLYNEYLKRKRVKSRDSNPGDLLTSLEMDSMIYPILWELLVRYRAKRVYIMQFHNGEKYYSGQSIQRMSMSHEVYDSQVDSIKKAFTDMPIDGERNLIIQDTIKAGKSAIIDVNALSDGEVKRNLLSRDAKSLYMYVVNNKKSQPIGLLNVSFSIPNALYEPDISSIKMSVHKVENILIKK